MSKIVKAAAAAALLLSGATYVAAQTQNPNAESAAVAAGWHEHPAV